MACQRKISPSLCNPFSPSLNLNDARATSIEQYCCSPRNLRMKKTIIVINSQMARKNQKKKQSKRKKKPFCSANEIKLCMLYYHFFLCIFIVMKTYVFSYLGGFPSLMRENVSDITKIFNL